MHRKLFPPILTILLFTLLSGCSGILPGEPDEDSVLAGPLEGLPFEQLAAHLEGDEQFAKIFGTAEGLGPVFVSNSCESCHIGDGKGHPLTTLTRFGRYEAGQWNPLIERGGPQLQDRSIAGYPPETVPPEATGIARFTPPAVTGLGFLAAVPDAALLTLSDPNDVDGNGISGVPNYIDPPDFFEPAAAHIPSGNKYIGRFGKKAGAIDLLQQVATAYLQDMGVTSDFFTKELFNVQAGLFTGDIVDDPEVSAAVVNNVVFYIRTLKAPPRRNENDPDVLAGESVFTDIGCAECHLPSLTTGVSDVEALSEKTFHAYTDLLLHDMGTALDDGYTEGTALTSEWRTPPLWGIGLAKDSQGGSLFLLHDGRAKSLSEAIEAHGGEAADSRDNFNALTAQEQTRLFKFLESL